MEEPNYKDKERAMQLRRYSKRGFPVTSEEVEFCDSLRKKYPEWYKATEAEIFEQTKPYGA